MPGASTIEIRPLFEAEDFAEWEQGDELNQRRAAFEKTKSDRIASKS
jgi:hypothetical protein